MSELDTMRRQWAADERTQATICGDCDGCGWIEGGDDMALGAKCARCAGSGLVNPQSTEGGE